MATMRSKYVPEEGKEKRASIESNRSIFRFLARATVMNYFRIPLNLIVVVILLRVKKSHSIARIIHSHRLGFPIENYLHWLCALFNHLRNLNDVFA